MINEILEAKDYLDGKNISLPIMYRMCYLMAKYLLLEDNDFVETRKRIFDWGKQNNIFIGYSLNDIIKKAKDDGVSLRGNNPIWISNDDVAEIASRFDNKTVRYVAISMLCLSKAHGGEFVISLKELSAWVGVSRNWLKDRILPELKDFGYLGVVEPDGGVRGWTKREKIYGTKFKVLVPIHNGEDFLLDGNNVSSLNNAINWQ